MASKTFHFPGFSIVDSGIKIDVSLNRFEKQFQDAQYALDTAVMTSMIPFMPKRDNILIDNTKRMSESIAGTGKVVAAAPPQGRFLYEGKVMVDPDTGSPWARKGAKKVLSDPLRYLTYDKSKNPKATDHWFDAAKEKDKKTWVKEVKKIAGGGKK